MNTTVALRMLALDANRRVLDKITNIGLTFCQYTLLSVIAEQPYINGAAAAVACGITPQTAWTGIANLVAAGYVTNEHEVGMGRSNPLMITESGWEALYKARRAVAEVDKYYDELLNVGSHPIDIAAEVSYAATINVNTVTKD